ncbi:DUF421 domain-containing protein [Piscibacillus halophilus]|uniref:Uncharacterized membrane protein YcaP, DUF421 family n=1 Tax=Piscibacillus halophilus TaxID=571933 RepID=A0A1H9IKL2_9BACI|nr:DUF421 domain-containing protein [Piscibacillus halophilus]SEQ74925.1 Uncharacterized membrane protein YcaP, DUF421 family [Piscibacillus halophilus]
MLLFIGKVSILFIIYVMAVRLLGKSALAQLTAHDFGALFFIAYLLFGSIEVNGMLQAIIGGATILLLYLAITKLTLWNKLNKYLIGEPTFFIKHGKIMSHNLKKSRYTLSELMSIIRTNGYFDINDVDYALLEPNGEISVLPKKDKGFITPSHLDLNIDDNGLPIVVIVEGEIQRHNLKSINKNEDWLINELDSLGYSQLNKIFLATVRDKDLLLKVYTEH